MTAALELKDDPYGATYWFGNGSRARMTAAEWAAWLATIPEPIEPVRGGETFNLNGGGNIIQQIWAAFNASTKAEEH